MPTIQNQITFTVAEAIVQPIEGDIARNVFVLIDFPFEPFLTMVATLVCSKFFLVPFPIDVVFCDWSSCNFILLLRPYNLAGNALLYLGLLIS